MHVLDEVDNIAYVKYIAHKVMAWYTKFSPKNAVAAGAFDAVVAEAAGAAPTSPRPR
jgi:hypothetical protein